MSASSIGISIFSSSNSILKFGWQAKRMRSHRQPVCRVYTKRRHRNPSIIIFFPVRCEQFFVGCFPYLFDCFWVLRNFARSCASVNFPLGDPLVHLFSQWNLNICSKQLRSRRREFFTHAISCCHENRQKNRSKNRSCEWSLRCFFFCLFSFIHSFIHAGNALNKEKKMTIKNKKNNNQDSNIDQASEQRRSKL